MNNKHLYEMEEKEFLLFLVKHIGNCYRNMSIALQKRGLPIEYDSFSKGLERAITHITEQYIKNKVYDTYGYRISIEDRLNGYWIRKKIKGE